MKQSSKLDDAIKDIGQTALAFRCSVSVSTVQGWLRRSRDGSGRLPDGERSKILELELGLKDFRVLFPHDWEL